MNILIASFALVASICSVTCMQSDKIFEAYEVNANKLPADHWKSITNQIFLFSIAEKDDFTGDVHNFLINYAQYPIKVQTGPVTDKPAITLTMADSTMVLISEGKLDGMKAYIDGKLKMSGNLMLAMKLKALFDLKGYCFNDWFVVGSTMQADKIFEDYQVAANKHPAEFWQAITDATFLYSITKNDDFTGDVHNFEIDYSQYPINVQTGPVTKNPGITLTMPDSILVLLREGKLDGMKAYIDGKLKISGNVMLAIKLKQLFDI